MPEGLDELFDWFDGRAYLAFESLAAPLPGRLPALLDRLTEFCTERATDGQADDGTLDRQIVDLERVAVRRFFARRLGHLSYAIGTTLDLDRVAELLDDLASDAMAIPPAVRTRATSRSAVRA